MRSQHGFPFINGLAKVEESYLFPMMNFMKSITYKEGN